jgi:hypothetical protein
VSSPISTSSNDEVVAYRKPRPDVFTVMLVVALLAIVFSIILLYAHMRQDFDMKFKGGPTPMAAASAPVDAWGRA